MKARDYLNLAKGYLYNKAKEFVKSPETEKFARGLFGGVTKALTERHLIPNDFPSPAISNIDTNIADDNWGTYGTFLGSTFTHILTDKIQPNAGEPATEGSVTQYAPHNPDSVPLKSVTVKNPPIVAHQDVVTGNEVPVKSRRVILRRRKVPVKKETKKRKSTKTKSVNEMVVPKPKKKKKRAVYKVEV